MSLAAYVSFTAVSFMEVGKMQREQADLGEEPYELRVAKKKQAAEPPVKPSRKGKGKGGKGFK